MLLKDNLEYYNGSVTAGGVWTLVSYNTAPSPVLLNIDGTNTTVSLNSIIGTDDNPDVTFSGIGEYQFKYTVSCTGFSSESILTVNTINNQIADDCAGLELSYPLYEGESVTLSPLTLCFCSTTYATGLSNPSSWVGSISGDMWLHFTPNITGQVRITINNLPHPYIAVYTGGCSSGTFVLKTHNMSTTNSVSTPYFQALANTSYKIRIATALSSFSQVDCLNFSTTILRVAS